MKNHSLPISIAFALSVTFASAQIDSNNNGMSDLWEKKYNQGQLFPDGFLPENDDDGDGQTNLEESIAGTNPLSGNPPEGLLVKTIHREEDVFEIHWQSLIGKQYTLFASPDLTDESWHPVAEPLLGDGNLLEFVPDLDGDLDKMFWRIEVEDVDRDEDNLTDHEEHLLGTNPLHSDTDLDGIPDDVDPLPLQNAVVADPDGLGLPASLAEGLIGRWDCEEIVNYGNNQYGFLDLAGGDHQLLKTIAGGSSGLTLDQNGIISRAVVFDDVGDHLGAPPSLVSGRLNFSISMWFKFDLNRIQNKPGVNANYLFAYKGGVTGFVEFFCSVSRSQTQNGNQTLVFQTNSSMGAVTSQNSVNISQLQRLDGGGWRHLVVVKEGNELSIYLDGNLVREGLLPVQLWNSQPNGYFCFGNIAPVVDSGIDVNFRGGLDRLRFYSRNLSAQEVSGLYQQDSDLDGMSDILEIQNKRNPFLWDEPD